MHEDGRSLERCGWGDKAIDRGDCLKDHITESGCIYDSQCKCYFYPFALGMVGDI